MSNAVAGTTSCDDFSARQSWPEKMLCRLLSGVRTGSITVTTPGGRAFCFSGDRPGPEADICIKRWHFMVRTIWGGHSGFFEGFQRGDWTTDDLRSLLEFGEENRACISGILSPSVWRRLMDRLGHRANRNSRRGSRRNIAAHYDLGNDFYRAWLDTGMTYSSGIFEHSAQTLAEAQQSKYLRLAEIAELSPGDHVLEIGCGWGGFAEIAARDFGCRVTALTLSERQADWCEDRMRAASLTDRVDIRLQDYRDVTGCFDKIVSIEMLEAVGERYWPLYFDTLRARLAPGGKAAIQSITIDDAVFPAYRKNPDFIQQYIFPGGMLPSPAAIEHHGRVAGLSLKDSFFFGKSYAQTLHLWDRAFQSHWPRIATLGFDQGFRRVWTYYLNYCAVGFLSGRIDVGHFLLEKE